MNPVRRGAMWNGISLVQRSPDLGAPHPQAKRRKRRQGRALRQDNYIRQEQETRHAGRDR
jgi:hypothetical protein